MIKTKSFDYTDAKGKESRKVIVVTQEPSEMLKGYDIGELLAEEQGELVAELAKAQAAYLAARAEIIAKYDLTNSYRQYKPASMTDVETESFV